MKILKLALPSIISNLTVPLMGLFDVAIVGHLSSTSYIGAIAIGGMMFSLLYWGFTFLRMGTGGLTAQAFGRGDRKEIIIQLYRPVLIAVGISLLILLLHRPIEWLILSLIGESGSGLNHWASVYFRIVVWGAPAVLSLYAFNGWFIGIQRPKITMYIALFQNILNVIFSLLFVYAFGLQVEGVALGTLLGQWAGVLLAVVCVAFEGRSPEWSESLSTRSIPTKRDLFNRTALLEYFHVNKNIFGRTCCLIAVTVSFTSFGARQGETLLAVNTLMMQLFTIFSYFMDGFAYAGESLSGAYWGAGERDKLRQTVGALFFWGWILMLLFALLYGVGGIHFLNLLTNQQEILQACTPYMGWSALIPVCGFAAFLWDGIYIGLTQTKLMFRIMFCAMSLYFLLYFLLFPYLQNHGLWLAFLSYLSLRGLLQGYYFRKIA